MANPFQYARYIQKAVGLDAEIQTEIIRLVAKMHSLGFSASFEKLEEGSVVRTYYFEPSPQSELSKLFSKPEDIALALGVESVMFARERALVTIAVPRQVRKLIKFDTCLHKLAQSGQFAEMQLPILMGESPRGELLYMDLAVQPHLMVAGATGAGKSVFTAQAICSLVLRHSPEELKLILADTKQLDLVLFEGLPHVTTVLRDIHTIRDTLETLIGEVRLRTARMSGIARNVIEWNNTTTKADNYDIKVLIIDEFADVVESDRVFLKGISSKDRPPAIDSLVKRLTQISRAAGIHVILATQRPSVKVIDGDLKTNFLARIAFKLPTMQDSRVVLDENGAERLLGSGDYLYRIAGSDTIRRGHGAFVEMKDIAMILSQHEMLRNQFVGGY